MATVAQKTRKISPLACYTKLSPNHNKPRNGKVRRGTVHCVDGNLTVEAILNLNHFLTYNAATGVSCTYAIGSDGRMGMGVEETNRPWTSSSRVNDHEAITYEIANVGPAPDYRMTPEAINTLLDSLVEEAKFYGFKKVNWQPKPANITPTQVEAWIKTWAKDDEFIITEHNWFTLQKVCPGPYLQRQLPWLIREGNKRLQDPQWIPEAFVGENAGPTIPSNNNSTKPSPIPTAPVGPVVGQTDPKGPTMFQPYEVRINASPVNVRKGPGTKGFLNTDITHTFIRDTNKYTIVEEANGSAADAAKGYPRWGRLKSGIGWIALKFLTRT